MFWNLGVWKRASTKEFVITDVLVGIPCALVVCSLCVLPDLTLIWSCRHRLSSSRHSAASCPLTPPLPFVSCTPPFLFASCLPAGCCIAPVVAPPPTLPRDFASTSSSPSGVATRNAPLVAPPPILVLYPPLPHEAPPPPLNASPHHNWLCRCRRRCADVVAIDVQASSPSSRLRLSLSAIVALREEVAAK